MQAIDDGDLKPEQVTKIAEMLNVPEQDVVSMNRRLAAPDHSLNAPLRSDSEGEWQDWLVDESESQESAMAEREEMDGRKDLLAGLKAGLAGKGKIVRATSYAVTEPTLETVFIELTGRDRRE